VRRDTESEGLEEAGAEGRVIRGGGLQQLNEQRPAEDAGPTEETIRFLIAFTRAMIRNNPSGDVLYLSMRAAADEANLSVEQAEKFIAWVTKEKNNSPWPKGFF